MKSQKIRTGRLERGIFPRNTIPNHNSQITQPAMSRVVIVGGGIAGVKAALTLQERGVSYVILEAQGRLGGRLKTVDGANGKYDLGASWFHETLNNALFDEESLLDDGKGKKWFYDDAPFRVIAEDGDVSPMLKLNSIVDEMAQYVEMENHKDLDKDIPFYDSLVNYLKKRKKLLSHEQINKSLEYARYLELWHGIDSKRLSSKYAILGKEGRDALALNYDRMLKRHTDQLDPLQVKLNSPVQFIEKMNNGRSVTVTTRAGEVYTGDYAIVTVPQSLLDPSEEGTNIVFTPSLPKSITESLKKMHFAALGKVVLEFDEVFWPAEHERILALGTAPEGFLDSILSDTEVPERSSSLSTPLTWEYPLLLLNFATSFQKPSFVVLTQSPLTEYLEANPDKAWDYMKPVISKVASMTNLEDVPDPRNIIVTDWTRNEFSRGSYSGCYPGDDPLSCVIALENGFGNIRFAGEHTILEGGGCVHGAWNSGKREAEYILDKLQ